MPGIPQLAELVPGVGVATAVAASAEDRLKMLTQKIIKGIVRRNNIYSYGEIVA